MSFLKSIKRKFWWVDMVYPLALALFLLSVITSMIYSGRPSSRLALMAEQELLNFSLAFSPSERLLHPGKVLVVSSDVIEMQKFSPAPRGAVPDLNANTYAQVIERVATLKPREIVVLWHGENQRFDAEYLQPFSRLAQKLPHEIKLTFATSQPFIADLEARLLPEAKIVNDSSCLFPDIEYIHSYCYFAPDWNQMLPQHLSSETIPEANLQGSPWLTAALPSNSLSYITLLPSAKDMHQVSFSDVLQENFKIEETPQVVIIGTDLTGTLAESKHVHSQYFVRTIHDPSRGNPQLTGTPSPLYWGQLAQTLIDGRFVRVPSQSEDIALTGAFCLMIFGIMLHYGGVAASGAFLFYVLASPFMNAFSIAFAKSYIPLFNSFYFGLSTLTLSGFGRLSHAAWQKWRAQAKVRAFKETAELKGHFISLLSHNLNTPVAKMQGMLALVSQFASQSLVKKRVQLAEALAARLQFAIRSVLVATALEEGEKAISTRNIKQLSDDFTTSYKTTLSKLGVALSHIHVRQEPEDAEELAMIPLFFDTRAVTMAIAGAAYLLSNPESELSEDSTITAKKIAVTFTVREPQKSLDKDSSEIRDRFGLTVRLETSDSSLSSETLDALTRTTPRGLRERTDDDFLQKVICGLLSATLKSFSGHMETTPHSLTIHLESATLDPA